MTKKCTTIGVLSFATFAGFTSSLAGQLEVGPLAKLYHKEAADIALQVSETLCYLYEPFLSDLVEFGCSGRYDCR